MTRDDAFERLRQSAEAGRLAHAYVVVGNPREEGRALAEKVVSLLFCTAKRKPCGACPACEQVRRHAHPDMLWIEPQSKSRRISVKQVREEVEPQIHKTSLTGEWKTCVIVAADRLGNEAGNAFLKTLEEPPGQCLFLLLTDAPQFLMPTIASRCQEVVVGVEQGEAPEPWRSRLLEILGEDIALGDLPAGRGERLDLIAGLARAARLLRMLREIKKTSELAEKEALGASAGEEDEETVDARVAARYRELRAGIMRSMLHWHRDILMLVCGVGEEHLRYRELAEVLRERAATLDHRGALRNIRTVETMYRRFERNLPDSTVLGCGFGELSA